VSRQAFTGLVQFTPWEKLWELAEGEGMVCPMMVQAIPVGFPTGQVGWN
jgi:hypothetical protein